MVARSWAAVTDERRPVGWVMTQLWGERVLVAAAAFVGFVMWAAGIPAGWVAFAILLLVIAGLLRIDRRSDGAAGSHAAADTGTAAAARLADRMAAYAAVLDALDAPALLLSKAEAVRAQNRAAEALFGAIPRDSDLAGRIRAPAILDMVREAIASGTARETEHAEHLPAETVYIVRIAPLVLRTGDHVSEPLWLLTFRDVSQARRIERMRSDFVANASHELRTPLASLRGFIETLQGPARNDPKAQERFLGIMHEQVTRMSRLVDDLLSLSRLELRSNLAPDQTVDLASVLSHVRDTLQPLASDLGVEVALAVPAHPVVVNGDRDELVEVFENLVENACKYGQEGKHVEVVLSGGEGAPAEVAVTDHGPGIPPEHVPRITERFYRINVEASRSKKGTGLGLAIVKHILTRHRARLVVKSEVGRGTVFTVKF